MMKKFNINSWNRKAQYEFFKNYDDPYFNLTANFDVTNLYNFCKENNISFFLACLFIAVETSNEILEFKLRIIDNQVFEFESINIGSTVLNKNNSFSFCYFERQESIFKFDKSGNEIIKKHQEGIGFDSNKDKINLIYASSIPWVSFTSIKHPRDIIREKSGIPKFVFGKFIKEKNNLKMPFSIEVHHALMDGYHVGKFIENFQKRVDNI